jgi:uncharacterized membrane protein
MSTLAETLPSSPRAGLWAKVGWVVLLLGALLAAVNALFFAATTPILDAAFGASGPSVQQQRMFEIAAIGYAHTLGGMIAMLIGPFQFLSAVRRHYPRVHRWLGRVYLACVAASGVAGLCLSPGSDARTTLGAGFIALALVWLYTGTKAYFAIRRRAVAEHRRWMIRNYALTYAAVTLRIEVPLLIILGGVSPILALDIVAWLCWVPNLLVVEAWLRRRPALAA